LTVETRYFTSATDTGPDGITYYLLQLAKTGSYATKSSSWQTATQQSQAYLRIYVEVFHADGTATFVAAGAVITCNNGDSRVLKSATISIPETSLEPTDRIRVIVQYSPDGETWTDLGGYEFMTEELNTTILNAATWTVYYVETFTSTYNFIYRRYVNEITFWFDGDYDSRIENFTYGEIVAVVKKHIGDGLVWYDST